MAQSSNPKETRSVRPWFPNASLTALRQEMNDLFENFFGESLPAFRWDAAPRMDVVETADAVEITTDLPGFKPEDINIDVGENYLTVSGNPSQESKADDPSKKFHRVERRLGSFSRSVWLPCPVDEEKVDATLDQGILKIKLPKREEAKRRKIPVRGGESNRP